MQRHGAHPVLLYGSRANGTAGADSDWDVVGFAPRATTRHEARIVEGQFLDLLMYPESELLRNSQELLRLRDALILVQRGDEASRFLQELRERELRGPDAMSADEAIVRRLWAWKMIVRQRRDDVEGRYRRVWLLTNLLGDYFQLRGPWYAGPKKSFAWLRIHDRPTHDAFENALAEPVGHQALCVLAERVVGPFPDWKSGTQ